VIILIFFSLLATLCIGIVGLPFIQNKNFIPDSSQDEDKESLLEERNLHWKNFAEESSEENFEKLITVSRKLSLRNLPFFPLMVIFFINIAFAKDIPKETQAAPVLKQWSQSEQDLSYVSLIHEAIFFAGQGKLIGLYRGYFSLDSQKQLRIFVPLPYGADQVKILEPQGAQISSQIVGDHQEYFMTYDWTSHQENTLALIYELPALNQKVNITFPYESIPGAFFFKLSQYPLDLTLKTEGLITMQRIEIDPREGTVEKFAWQGIRKGIEGPFPQFIVEGIPFPRSHLIKVFLSLGLMLLLAVLYQIVQMIRMQGYKNKDS
jgi:hypothetical protein